MEKIQARIDFFVQKAGKTTEAQNAYRNFLYIVAQPMLFSTDLLYVLWANFKHYRQGIDAPTHLVVSDLILSSLCRPVGVDLYRMEESTRQYLLETDTNRLLCERENPHCIIGQIARLVEEYAQRHKTTLGRHIFEIHNIWAMGILRPEDLAQYITQKMRTADSPLQKANFLNLYIDTLPQNALESAHSKLAIRIAEAGEAVDVVPMRGVSERLREVLKEKPKAKKSLFLTDFFKPTDFVGRQDELQHLHMLLEAGSAIVIVNGLGGVGKTALARQYVQLYKENYHNIVWIEQQNTLLSALITNERLTENMYFTNETEEYRFYIVMRRLAETKGKNLLVIDNYEQKDIDDKLDVLEHFLNAQFSHWRVLFTSREQVRRFQSIDLSFLPTHEAIELFTLHCENKTFDEKTLELLLEEVGKHTLTIELLAKTYANNFDIECLEDLLTVLQQKEYDHSLLQELIDTEHHKGYEPLYKHLLLLFDMEHWTNEEQYILKQFTVLPSLPIKAKQLLDWLQYEKRVYKNTLQNLARKGWLSTKDQQQYEMHRLLKVLIQKHLGVRWEDVKVMVESVKDELAEDKIIANPLASQWLIEYINSFLENINFQDNKVDEGYLWFRLGFIYYFMSFYDDAKQCYEKALNIVSTDKGTFNKEYAHILNELGIVLENERKYEEAIALHQKALQIRKEVLGEKHYDFATSLNNLATLYQKMGEYEKALPLYQEALQIYQAVLGRKHPIYAQSLNDLAILYNKQDKYQEALVLHMEAAHIRQEVLGRQHPDFAQSIQNLGVVYFQQGDYEQAKKYLAEAYYIYVEKLGTQHPHTQNTKEWLDKIDALPNPKLS